ncbi:hypothetical protein M758_6G211300 [Ceratodon purpureus]|uniref:Uncharacterized protein n=1 Tax=Ceratodon purpureus TaxID=3225 RepID=A0A8T0HKC9_CERPU|nr:hypothetical protein KC19_6G221100 [Ceratodon purpureus]KAG0614884.1 hypothetical protein M758_6G211300 [Ceratodon purpureus]
MQFQFLSIRVIARVLASTNSTTNVQEDGDFTPTYYQQAPTMFFVIAGLASMLFLIVIAIALLCYSHYINYFQNQSEMRSQSSSSVIHYSENDSRDSFSQWSSPETPHQTTPILFVCNPGHSKPTFFAQVAPLRPNNASFHEPMNNTNENYLYFQTNGLFTPTTVESMPMSPLQLQSEILFQEDLHGENSSIHSTIFQPAKSNVNITHRTSLLLRQIIKSQNSQYLTIMK